MVDFPTCERLHLMTINVNNVHNNANDHGKPKVIPAQIRDINDLKLMYPQQFDKIRNFAGTAKLHLREDVEPFMDAPRKCSVHIKDKLKHELDSMVSHKVNEHTDWCSSLTFTTKKDGSILVCRDLKRRSEEMSTQDFDS